MVTINGNGGDDTIDVTNDNGTLNGTPQGTPVDRVAAAGGNDEITVTGSTVSGRVLGQAGDDTIVIDDSTINDRVNANAGNDVIIVTSSQIAEDIRAGGGNDSVSVSGSTADEILLAGGNDTISLINTDVTGVIGGGNGTDVMNLPAGTVVNDNTFGTFTVVAGTPYSLSGGTFTLPSGIVNTYNGFENGTGFPCFSRGTGILTHDGLRKIEDLVVGEMIPTQENGLQPIRWIGSRTLTEAELQANPKLYPIRIMAGAMGDGLPDRDLVVSRQHRMLVRSRIAKRMYGKTEVLIPAIKLTELPGIFIDEVDEVEYFHLLFDQHEVITAEGAPTESLFTGPEALKSLGPAAREEILTLFPELATMDYTPIPARFIPPGKQQKQLIARHLKNNKMPFSIAI